jgi:hypothetical protein
MRNLEAGESSLMNTSGGTTAVSQSRPFAAIFWGGLFAGAFDLTQAFIGFGLLGATPYRILQHIAGGIFGMRSYQMGSMSAAIGFLLHFTIAFTAATIYYLSSRKIRVLVEQSIICGLLYGEAVFLFMYFAVLPLSVLGPSLGFRSVSIQYRDLYHRPHRPPSSGRIADRAFRPALRRPSERQFK